MINKITEMRNATYECVGFYELIEEKYGAKCVTFSNPMSKDLHLNYDDAQHQFGIKFLHAVLNGKTAWSVYVNRECVVKAGFTPDQI